MLERKAPDPLRIRVGIIGPGLFIAPFSVFQKEFPSEFSRFILSGTPDHDFQLSPIPRPEIKYQPAES